MDAYGRRAGEQRVMDVVSGGFPGREASATSFDLEGLPAVLEVTA